MESGADRPEGPNLDRERSSLLARRVRAQYRRCWRNAAVAMRYLGDDARYVEGWIVVDAAAPLVIEHGWCEMEGKVIDPTYTPWVSPLREPLAYFSGLRLPGAEAAVALERGRLPVTWGSEFPEYEDAFRAAFLESKRRAPADPRPPTQVVNCRCEEFDVYIGRPTRWRNPFRIGADGSRGEVIQKFRRWAIRRPMLLSRLEEIRGKRLGCICAPEPCHGDILAELADMGRPVLLPGDVPVVGKNDGGGFPSVYSENGFGRPVATRPDSGR